MDDLGSTQLQDLFSAMADRRLSPEEAHDVGQALVCFVDLLDSIHRDTDGSPPSAPGLSLSHGR